MERSFRLSSKFRPAGDQAAATSALLEGLRRGEDRLVLKGVTGSGKTFTMANLIAAWNRPTLILSHNKTLAAQLFAELKEFFPENSVEYLFRTTTTISPKRTYRKLIHISKRMLR